MLATKKARADPFHSLSLLFPFTMTSTLSTLWFYLSPDDLIHTHTSLCILWIGFLFSYILVGPPFPSLFSFSSFFFTHLISLMIDKTNPCPIDQIKVQYMEPATISSCNRARAHSPLHEMVPQPSPFLKKLNFIFH